MSSRYTEDQLNYLKKLYQDEVHTWAQMAQMFNEKFGTCIHHQSLRYELGKHIPPMRGYGELYIKLRQSKQGQKTNEMVAKKMGYCPKTGKRLNVSQQSV